MAKRVAKLVHRTPDPSRVLCMACGPYAPEPTIEAPWEKNMPQYCGVCMCELRKSLRRKGGQPVARKERVRKGPRLTQCERLSKLGQYYRKARG